MPANKQRFVTKAALVAVALSACGPTAKPPPPPPEQEATKVGFIYVGPIGDYGWTKSHEEGRLYLENFGNNITTTFQESVLQADSPKVIDEMVAAGAKVVVTTSFDYLQQAQAAVARHPGVIFLNASGFKKGERFGTFMVRMEEAEFLSGMVAGRMTKTNKIGVVAALKNYEQVLHLNAFTLGARSVNPDVQVLVRWVGFWFDPPREAIGARELIQDEGVDVIKGFTDTSIPIEEAHKLNVLNISHDNKDGCSKAPGTCLTSNYYNWGPLYVKLLEEITAGTYPAGGRIDYVSMADLDVLDLAPLSDKVPEAVRTEVMAKRQQLLDRQFNVFTGPIAFQGPITSLDNGATLAAGETLTDAQLSCAKSLVEGVVEVAGPACGGDADCKHEILGANMLTCVGGKCVAPDVAGCPQ